MYEIKVEKKNLIITDPCYLDNVMIGVISKVPQDYWSHICSDYSDDCSSKMERYGFTNNICCGTMYGDWSCTVYQTEVNPIDALKTVEDLNVFLKDSQESRKEIGSFCADAGMVCVVDADELRKFNPAFFEWALFHKHCVTSIFNFTGTIGIHEVDPHWKDTPNYRHRLVYGIADKEKNKYGHNFVSLQTGY